MLLNKKFLLITVSVIILAAALIISGCKGGGFSFGFGSSSSNMQTFDYQKGTDGVSIDFVKDLPPDLLFVGTDMSVGLLLKNKGAYSIANRAFIEVVPAEKGTFSFIESNKKSFTLEGKSRYVREGEETLLLFPMKSLCFPGFSADQNDNYTTTFIASACYYYQTQADSNICIDTNIYRKAHEKPECEVKQILFSGGQGGPVGVTQITTQKIPFKSDLINEQFTITIKKFSDDMIFSSSVANCAKTSTPNEVDVEVYVGGQRVSCTPYQTVKISESQPVSIVCDRKYTPNKGAFTTPISVIMKYNIHQKVVSKSQITPPPGVKVDCNTLSKSGSTSLLSTT